MTGFTNIACPVWRLLFLKVKTTSSFLTEAEGSLQSQKRTIASIGTKKRRVCYNHKNDRRRPKYEETRRSGQSEDWSSCKTEDFRSPFWRSLITSLVKLNNFRCSDRLFGERNRNSGGEHFSFQTGILSVKTKVRRLTLVVSFAKTTLRGQKTA